MYVSLMTSCWVTAGHRVYDLAFYNFSWRIDARGNAWNLSRLLPVPQRKLLLKALTFTARSAIQLKYQSHNIKVAALLTLTEVQPKRRQWSQSHWYIDKCTFRQQKKKKGLFLCMCPACTSWFSSTEPAEWWTTCAPLFLSFLQSIYRSPSWWRCRTIGSDPCLPASSRPPPSINQVLKCYRLRCCQRWPEGIYWTDFSRWRV